MLYQYLLKLLLDFQEEKNFSLRINTASRFTKREFTAEKKYWKKFYNSFTDYLYIDLGCYDNYVGSNIKMLRAFFNYLSNDHGLNHHNFHKSFYVRKEEIPITVLTPEQLNYLIFDIDFENRLSEKLKRTKDIFVFGCTVALRVSDLMKIRPHHLEIIGENYYLKVHSKKTLTYTRIKLPDYSVAIVRKYKGKQKHLLPQTSLFNLNKNIRLLMQAAEWTQPCIKTRWKKGIMVPLYKNPNSKEHYRFCDLVSSHTMRRTAITTMLSLGMPEHLVRKISGHAANSTEFFKYVALSQLYVDNETDRMFGKLEQKTLFKVQGAA